MRDATVKKVNGNWKCFFKNKKGKVSSKPISSSGLISWLEKHIEDPSKDTEVKIPQNTILTKVVMGNETYNKKGRKTQKGKDMGENKKEKIARAPYNFVPLNDKVAFTVEKDRYESFDHYDANKLSGYIQVSVKNLTPLFIRQVSKDPENFKIGDKYGIPGSSMRGMIRTICEILSYGKFGPIKDKRLYYRSIYHEDPHNKKYKDELGKVSTVTFHGRTISVPDGVKAGYLKNEYIYQAKQTGKKNKTYKRINKYDWKRGLFMEKKNNGVLVQTGGSTGKKTQYLIYEPDRSKKYNVDENVLKRFQYDNNRGVKVNKYIEDAKSKCENGLPVFYVEENGEVKHFGHTPFYRIPYEKMVSNHIPDNIEKREEYETDNIDLVQALFGDTFMKRSNDSKKRSLASRLSFGDLLIDDGDVYKNAKLLKILSSPKLTTFQHYVEQGDDAEKPNNDWNSDANIRGFKLYWHRRTDENKKGPEGHFDLSWTEDKEDYNKNVNPDPVKPIKPNARFSGKIWFQNLCETELGLLLEALEPSIEYDKEQSYVAHKIGLAKPLGLGSIKISVEDIHCMDIKHMYEGKKARFIRKGQCAPQMKKGDQEALKESFQKELLERLNDDNTLITIWELDRLKELKEMLEYDPESVSDKEWLQKTRYMDVKNNEFSKRPILKKPSEVKKASMDSFVDKENK